jgi:hypothetical protein
MGDNSLIFIKEMLLYISINHHQALNSPLQAPVSLLVSAAVSSAVVAMGVIMSDLSGNMLLQNRRRNLSGIGGIPAGEVVVAVAENWRQKMSLHEIPGQAAGKTYDCWKVFS